MTGQPRKVEVAPAGDLGYLRGTYALTFDDPAEEPASDRGQMLEIWNQQPDGTWKCIRDRSHSELPAAPPTRQ